MDYLGREFREKILEKMELFGEAFDSAFKFVESEFLRRQKRRDRKLAEALKKGYPEITYEFGTYFVDAPVVIAAAWKPICDPPRSEEVSLTGRNVWDKYKEDITVGLMSTAHAIQNLLLATIALGLAAGYIGPIHGDVGFEDILGLEKPYRVCTIIPIGYPAEKKTRKQKDTLELIKII